MSDKTIRTIINNLVQDCQDMDTKIDIVNMSVTLALTQIHDILVAELPTDYKKEWYKNVKFEGDSPVESFINGYNLAKKEVTKTLDRLLK